MKKDYFLKGKFYFRGGGGDVNLLNFKWSV